MAALVAQPPMASRQHTPSDTQGILGNNNVKLEERLDLVDFLDAMGDDIIGDDLSIGNGSDSSAPVGVSMLPAAAVSWSAKPDSRSNGHANGHGHSNGHSSNGNGHSHQGNGHASSASSRLSPSRRSPSKYSSALEVAMDAERRGALNILQDEIPTMAPWYLQMTFCLCALSLASRLAPPMTPSHRAPEPTRDPHAALACELTDRPRVRSLPLLWR